ncbi:MAG: hypothetical protein WKG07_00670 [Hymenobacter sp.]
MSAGSGTVQVGSYLAIDVTDYVKSQLATGVPRFLRAGRRADFQ